MAAKVDKQRTKQTTTVTNPGPGVQTMLEKQDVQISGREAVALAHGAYSPQTGAAHGDIQLFFPETHSYMMKGAAASLTGRSLLPQLWLSTNTMLGPCRGTAASEP